MQLEIQFENEIYFITHENFIKLLIRVFFCDINQILFLFIFSAFFPAIFIYSLDPITSFLHFSVEIARNLYTKRAALAFSSTPNVHFIVFMMTYDIKHREQPKENQQHVQAPGSPFLLSGDYWRIF